jgi:hypothetical protein
MQRRFPVRPGQLNTLLNKNVLSLDLKTATDELDKTVAGIKFNIVGAALRNARLPISVVSMRSSILPSVCVDVVTCYVKLYRAMTSLRRSSSEILSSPGQLKSPHSTNLASSICSWSSRSARSSKNAEVSTYRYRR